MSQNVRDFVVAVGGYRVGDFGCHGLGFDFWHLNRLIFACCRNYRLNCSVYCLGNFFQAQPPFLVCQFLLKPVFWVSFLFQGNLPVQDTAMAQAPPPPRQTEVNLKESRPEGLQSQGMPSHGQSAVAEAAVEAPPKAEPVRVEKKVGRNDACPCGSGKKYKHCHGKAS